MNYCFIQIQKLIKEYTEKWNAEKKLKVQMRRKRVFFIFIYLLQRKEGRIDKEEKEEEEKSESQEPPLKQERVEEKPSTKLDLKKLAFVLDDDE